MTLGHLRSCLKAYKLSLFPDENDNVYANSLALTGVTRISDNLPVIKILVDLTRSSFKSPALKLWATVQRT